MEELLKKLNKGVCDIEEALNAIKLLNKDSIRLKSKINERIVKLTDWQIETDTLLRIDAALPKVENKQQVAIGTNINQKQ